MHKIAGFASSLLLVALAAAQDSPDARQQAAGIPLVQLQSAYTREVPFVAMDAISTPIVCASDGSSFVQLVRINTQSASSAMGDILAISRQGDQVVQFGLSKINDITEAVDLNLAVSDSDLYLLVRGSIPKNKILTFRKPDGGTFRQQAAQVEEYVARFKKDGSYLGAVRLEIPFAPLQLGVFPGGDFLIAGYEKNTFEPRIALVKSSGQFQRWVELPGDLHGKGDSAAEADSVDKVDKKDSDPAALPRFGKTFNDNLAFAVHTSMIIADGRNMLLLRPGYKVPVFSVSPGGEVKAIHLEMPDGYALADLKVANGKWIAIYTRRRQEGNGLQIETVALDPATGKMTAQYTYSHSLGLAAACVSQEQISFLTTQDTKLIWNVLSIPASGPGK